MLGRCCSFEVRQVYRVHFMTRTTASTGKVRAEKHMRRLLTVLEKSRDGAIYDTSRQDYSCHKPASAVLSAT